MIEQSTDNGRFIDDSRKSANDFIDQKLRENEYIERISQLTPTFTVTRTYGRQDFIEFSHFVFSAPHLHVLHQGEYLENVLAAAYEDLFIASGLDD